MTYCQADLLGIIKVESGFNCNAENIGTPIEKSYGCYQIRLDMPNRKHITIENAKDMFWSSAWTINRLVAYGWLPRTIDGKANRYAIKAHNSVSKTYMTDKYTVNAVYWSEKFINDYGL